MYDRLFFAHLYRAGWEAVPARSHDETHSGVARAAQPAENEGASENAPMMQDDHDRPPAHVASDARLPDVTLRPTGSSSTEDAHLQQLYLQSCHRCLLFRGDLERYAQLLAREEEAHRSKWAESSSLAAAPSSAFDADWSGVERFYLLAASLLPGIGNPWNQLAVIATYRHDSLLAVQRYLRAIAAETPFPTAAVNVRLLFETTIDETVYAKHDAKHAQQATTSSRVFTDTPVCTHFMFTPWLDFGWVHLFALMWESPPPAQASHRHAALPCVAHSVLTRFRQQMAGGATLDLDFALRILISFFACMPDDGDDPPARQEEGSAMEDHMVDAPASAASSTLAICIDFLSLTMSRVRDGTAPLIGLVTTFLRWLLRRRDLTTRIMRVPPAVRQIFAHELARIAEITANHLASRQTHGSETNDATDRVVDPLPEESEVRGIAAFAGELLTEGADLTTSNADPRADIRRCGQLLDLAHLLSQRCTSLLVARGGRLFSAFDAVADSSTAPATSAAASVEEASKRAAPTSEEPQNRAETLLVSSSVPSAPSPAAPLPLPEPVTYEQVGAQLAASFARSFTVPLPSSSGSLCILLPTTLPAISLRPHRSLAGFAPEPTTAAIAHAAHT